MELSVVPLHKYPEYLRPCCDLINKEWKRSDTARLRTLESSCDQLPVCLILLKGKQLIGHAKLSAPLDCKGGCLVESVVIDKSERGKGYGAFLMKCIEEYCRSQLNLSAIYLYTQGQEGFYHKLGYNDVMQVPFYGGRSVPKSTSNDNNNGVPTSIPKAPPIPNSLGLTNSRTFMKKDIFI